MRHPQLPAASLVFLVLAGGCGPDFVRSGAQPPPTPKPPPVAVGQGLRGGTRADPDAADETAANGPLGRFVLTLVDENGHNPSGIPLRIRGPRNADLESGLDGRLEFRAPPGTYEVEIPLGCTEDLEILAATGGRFGIVAGDTGRAEIGVRWRHRFGPSPPVFSSRGPHWPVGEEIEVRFGIVDRCRRDTPPAPGRPFPTYAFETNDRVELTRDPHMRSDGDGHAFVHVACTAVGTARLVVYDTENPLDRLDLIAADYGLGGSPSCGPG